MQRSLSAGQYFSFMLTNLPLLKDTADTAAKVSAAKTYVERVAIVNPYLTRIAPVADQFQAMMNSGVSARSTAAELKRRIIFQLSQEDESERALFNGDGKWLEQGRKFFQQFVLPLLVDQLSQQLLGSREPAAE